MTGIPFCGDIHDKAASVRPVVERRLERTGADTLVLLGDLLNDWWMTAPEETAAFAALAEAIDAWRADGVTVHVLLGNHDLIYMMPQDSPEAHRMRACSPGYLPGAHRAVHDLLRALDPRIAFGLTLPGGVPLLCTHAVLAAGWIRWSARVPGTPAPADAPSIAAWLDEGFAARSMAFAERVGTARGGRPPHRHQPGVGGPRRARRRPRARHRPGGRAHPRAHGDAARRGPVVLRHHVDPPHRRADRGRLDAAPRHRLGTVHGNHRRVHAVALAWSLST